SSKATATTGRRLKPSTPPPPIAGAARRSPASSNDCTCAASLRRFPAHAAGGSPNSGTPSSAPLSTFVRRRSPSPSSRPPRDAPQISVRCRELGQEDSMGLEPASPPRRDDGAIVSTLAAQLADDPELRELVTLFVRGLGRRADTLEQGVGT